MSAHDWSEHLCQAQVAAAYNAHSISVRHSVWCVRLCPQRHVGKSRGTSAVISDMLGNAEGRVLWFNWGMGCVLLCCAVLHNHLRRAVTYPRNRACTTTSLRSAAFFAKEGSMFHHVRYVLWYRPTPRWRGILYIFYSELKTRFALTWVYKYPRDTEHG